MNAKAKKWTLIAVAVALVAGGVGLALQAFNDNLVFFYSPSQVVRHEAPVGKTFRLGGVVEPGSVKRLPDGVTVEFEVTDSAHKVNVRYKGILPDLFSEGQGVVTQGKLNEDGQYVASEVLAKHDENYMPPEVAKAMEEAHKKGVERGEPKPANHPTSKP